MSFVGEFFDDVAELTSDSVSWVGDTLVDDIIGLDDTGDWIDNNSEDIGTLIAGGAVPIVGPFYAQKRIVDKHPEFAPVFTAIATVIGGIYGGPIGAAALNALSTYINTEKIGVSLQSGAIAGVTAGMASGVEGALVDAGMNAATASVVAAAATKVTANGLQGKDLEEGLLETLASSGVRIGADELTNFFQQAAEQTRFDLSGGTEGTNYNLGGEDWFAKEGVFGSQFAFDSPEAERGFFSSDLLAGWNGAGGTALGDSLMTPAASEASFTGSGPGFDLGDIVNKENLGIARGVAGIFGDIYGRDAAASAAARAAGTVDPFGSQRGTYAEQLQELINNPNSLRNDPGYKFRLSEGINAIESSNAARGMLNSGNNVAALQKYGTGLADQYYNTRLNQLSELAGAGINGTGAAANYQYQGDMAQSGGNAQLYADIASTAGSIWDRYGDDIKGWF